MRESWDNWEARIAASASRARAALAAGATLDDVLRTFRTRDRLDTLDAEAALGRIASQEMDRHTAELIVRNSSVRSYAHLTLADLELLGDTPRGADVAVFTRYHRDEAIIERKPFLLYVRRPETTRSVALHASVIPLDEPLAEHTHQISGEAVTFEGICDDVRRSAAAWPTELSILRNAPDQLLLHFVRAPSNNAKA